ncbi:MAG: MBL fold metallo-hydrolase [Clostridia bacterium]|nr:MBL fold metallo-hydrolase [Clostridia bacterium]
MKKYVTKKGTAVICLDNPICNSFLIDNGQQLLMVDTSVRFMQKRIENQMKQYSDRKPIAIVQTHCHYDHVRNTAYFQKKFRCPVYIHQKEKPDFVDGICTFPEGTTFLFRCVALLIHGLRVFKSYPKPLRPVIGITSGTDIECFTSQVRVIETPGHTYGSISLIIDNEFVLVGDAMRNVYRKTYPMFGDDEELMCDSLEQLLKLPGRLFFPSHGTPFKHPQHFDFRRI